MRIPMVRIQRVWKLEKLAKRIFVISGERLM
jgi:hypothetical protein